MYFRFLTGPSLVSAFAICLTAGSAQAHAYPDSISPPNGAILAQAPREVRIQFTEGVELEFSRIDVKTAKGQKVTRETVRRVSADTLAVDLVPLEPGNYTVEWQVLSVDTHITEGVLRFTFKPSMK